MKELLQSRVEGTPRVVSFATVEDFLEELRQ